VDHPLVIPVNKKVRILMTSADVIHAWWVPEFGWKKDAIPGFVTDGWVKVEKTGIYRGQCTELCGRDHGFMPIVVEVKSEVDYAAWIAAHKPASAQVKAPPAATTAPSAQLTTTNATLATQTLSRDELLTKGKEVYDGNCAGCHGANGEGIAGAFPAIKGSAVATGPVSEHLGVVYKGKRAMPAFGELLNPTQIASVVTYQRNALGNSQGDLLQPSDVQVQN
jgi:cytochrome c oxidase subunit 2